MANEIPHKLSKTLLGKWLVKYKCSNCGELLEADITEAGNQDACPSCNTRYTVPGVSKKREMEVKQKAEEEQKRRREKEVEEERVRRLREEEAEKLVKQQQVQVEEARRRQEQILAEQEKRSRHSGFVYHVAYFAPTNDNCNVELSKLINRFSEDGWEYLRLDILQTYRPPGCLAALLGQHGELIVHHMVTFRRRIS